MTLGRLDDPRGPILKRGGEPAFECVGGLDHMVVDGNHRVTHGAGLRIGEEQIGVERGHRFRPRDVLEGMTKDMRP